MKNILEKALIFSNTNCFIVLFLCTLLLFSCKAPQERPRQNEPVDNSEELIKNYQMIVKDESNQIDSYIARRNLDMSQTETGLRYRISRAGKSDQTVVDNTHVLIKYSVMLLDGTRVYDSDSTGELEIKIGKSEVASGLQEGLKLMKEGDKALFIIPSHLAYGLSGDGDKIKYYQALVVNVDSMKIISNP
jgi:FKBP-type peptidyl-prolyl cis-trans isomerase